MSSNLLIALELLLVLGVVLGIGFWELWSVRRSKDPPRGGNEPR